VISVFCKMGGSRGLIGMSGVLLCFALPCNPRIRIAVRRGGKGREYSTVE
jgi:hypothetical protein